MNSYEKSFKTIKSLHIPNIEAYVYENISSFIRDIFIHSEERELIPDLLNSALVDWDDAECLTVSMKFMLEDVTVILNKENSETTEINHDKICIHFWRIIITLPLCGKM